MLDCLSVLLMLQASLSLSVVSDSGTPWTAAHQTPLSVGFSREECWSRLPCPSPGDLPNQGLNPHLLCFLHCRWILYLLSQEGHSSVQSNSRVRLFATPWTAERQASLSITNSQSPPKLMSIASVMASSHLILCRPLVLLPSIFPSIRVFSNESALHIRWPKY